MKQVVIGLGLVFLSSLLAGCGQKKTAQPESQVSDQAVIDEKANQFLANRGITLPEGVTRANLKDVGILGGTGVATQEKAAGSTTYSVIADLPDPKTGFYEGWLQKDASTVIALGQLTLEKGGYMVEKITSEDWSGYPQVVVSQETAVGATPTIVVLEGSFE